MRCNGRKRSCGGDFGGGSGYCSGFSGGARVGGWGVAAGEGGGDGVNERYRHGTGFSGGLRV